MRFVLLLLIMLLPLQTFAARRGSPFHPHDDIRFDEMENDSQQNPAIARKYAKIVYEPAVDGGASNSTNNLGVYLPANAVITRGFFYVNTVFAGAGGGIQAGSLGFQCSGTLDLMAAQDIDALPAKSFLHSYAVGATSLGAANVIASGAPIRIQGIGSSVASACQVVAVVRGSSGDEDLASGKGTLLLEYFLAN
jgi:hypothetical protein